MAWYDEAVFYHIYPLGLLGAPKLNSYGKVDKRLPKLLPWIEHIKEIGCNAIYIGPLFMSVGHGYETTDYKVLDSRLGDNDDLKAFVARCHELDMKVIFDGVFNHTGRDFFAFKDLKEHRENSRYKDWYCNVNFYGNNSYNDGFSYENWGGYDLLVKLNQKNGEVKDYICNVIRYWVSEFDVDGIRLDAADVLDFDFMKELRRTADSVKKDFWLMGEVIHGEYSRWANHDTLHSVTNYHLHKALYSGHNDHNYFEIAHTVKRLYDMGGNNPNGLKLYNFVDNHDVERIYTKLSNKANFFPVHVLLYSLPGIPSIYYGSEFGIEGRKYRGGSDDDIRPCLELEDYKDAINNNPCTKIVSALGKIRQRNKALSYGDYREVKLTNRQFVFVRNYYDDNVIVSVNNDESPCTVSTGNLPDGEYVGAISGRSLSVTNGYADIYLDANSGEIWVHKAAMSDEFVGNIDMPKVNDNVGNIKADEDDIEAREINIEDNSVKDFEQGCEAEVVDASNKALEAACEKKEKLVSSGLENNAAKKYNLGDEYSHIDSELIKNRTDYEAMSIEELQVAILEKMAQNCPVTDDMKRTVMENRHSGSLNNWVKSFR